MDFIAQTFTLLIAPPAWGKTSFLVELMEANPDRYLFISPLRALALEVKSRAPRTWICIPEEILTLDWQGLKAAHPELIVIWDEVHLICEWGLTFRDALIESWLGYCSTGLAGIGLTATFQRQHQEYLNETLSMEFTHLLIGDAGNMEFRFRPRAWLWAPSAWLQRFLLAAPEGRTLIFCRYRGEVDVWVTRLAHRGLEAWGVKGGETRQFQERLASEAAPAFLVATSCLSHGVNLPSLARVVVLDSRVPNWMLHQMSTRAGRRGEAFEVWGDWRLLKRSRHGRIGGLWRFLGRAAQHFLAEALARWWYDPRRHCDSDHPSERA